MDLAQLAGGPDTPVARVARLLIIVCSLVGMIVMPPAVWLAKEAYLKFEKVAIGVESIQIQMAGYAELKKARDNDVAMLRDADRDHNRQIWEHEKRIARLEGLPQIGGGQPFQSPPPLMPFTPAPPIERPAAITPRQGR